MSNAEQLFFSDFTRSNYRTLLQMAKQRYSFRNFTDFKPDEQFVIWRHDVDFSVHSAHKLALIEQQEGVCSTYFFDLHSPFYNILEREISNLIMSILSMGHNLGIHFDSHYYDIADQRELDEKLQFERKIFKTIFGITPVAFSFHVTTPFTMGCQNWQYGGLINAYAAYFQKEVAYCSDSNGYWRFRRLQDVLSSGPDDRLQVLTHPAWWQDSVLSPKERVWRCIDGRAEKTRKNLLRLLAQSGRILPDWE